MIYTSDVIPGRGEGRKYGFPTLNMAIPPGFDAGQGIYAGWVWLSPADASGGGTKGERLPAAIHYGPVPAFGIEALSLEAHVIGRDIHTPPKEISLELVKYLREVKDFKDVATLGLQIQEDVRSALAALSDI
jgi:riboflavin kinase/FMN adenylyltransferase